ncbi:MAG: tRNA 2-thiouridine(34) synthase MnmA, partial [Actinobacteria bacterium]|nr:tRNA 2-thiouridine(34) synthase MnmA [Actinomycetota bacterium]
MRVLVAMSGGVDSSVAAALMVEYGHDVAGVTLKLWGGDSDSGCCSVSDVDDARRVAQQLDIDHHVFNFSDDFNRHVVEPYVVDHAAGLTPNPCIECNRYLKFDRLLERTRVLGFDRLVTGHHVRMIETTEGLRLARSADSAKDQSYVLHMISVADLATCLFPLGEMTKSEVRDHAHRLNLRTAGKPDSQDLCFVTKASGRAKFLADRIELHSGDLVDADGNTVGRTDSVELVTIGQRRGLDLGGSGDRRYAVDVDVPRRRVVIGNAADLVSVGVRLESHVWVDGPVSGPVAVQVSAHGA